MVAMKMFSRGSVASVAVLGCAPFIGVQTVLAESLRSADQDGVRIVKKNE